MKIVYFNHGLTLGGAETIVVNQLINLKLRGIDVSLVIRHKSSASSILVNKLEKNNIKIISLFEDLPDHFFPKYVSLIRQKLTYKKVWNYILQIEKPDLIYIHTTVNLIYDINFPVDKMIYTFHSEVNRSLNNSRKSNFKYLKNMAKEGMTFFALSDEMKRSIETIFSTNKVIKIPNFIDVNGIYENKYSKEVLFRDYNIPCNSFILGHVGRFHKVKNHEKIIDVFNKIYSKNKNSFLLLIGGDFEGRIKLIKDKIASYGLSRNVIFLGEREDATRYMGCFDAFILPSFSESFSLVLVEAQAARIRCVASDIVPEDVICNADCFTLSLNDSDDKWADLLMDKSKNNVKNDIFQFDVKTVIDKMIYEFLKILK